MPMNIIYREAEPSDAGKFLEYCKRVGGETDNLTFGEEGIPFSISQEADYIRKFAGNPESVMIVAFDEGELVGTGAVSVISGRPRFSHRKEIAISVRKDYWGKGIGTGIMNVLMDFAKKSGAEVLELQVRSDNEGAIALYKKFGFEKIGTNEKYFKIRGEYYPADFMVLSL
ncbi:MAG: GNAT family N-acetyltransferase [Oscillospiraceae bacterium]|nr:GNAT family N-acetyltransferase [Oscillospiraceae bacterium]